MGSHQDDVVRSLREKKIFILSDLIDSLSCSVPTARRRLKKWGTYSSYNKNASYYALPDIPKFDENGIWRYKGVYFSKHGTLQKTILALIENSTAGLTVVELEKILAKPVYNILSPLAARMNVLHREKYQGIYVYYSGKPPILKKQHQERESQYKNLEQCHLPSDADCVIILVELIKHPKYQPEQLVRCVKNKGLSISITMIEDLFRYHDLLKKNKAGT